MQNDNTFLGTERIGKLLFRLALPAVTAQLVNMLYNLVPLPLPAWGFACR